MACDRVATSVLLGCDESGAYVLVKFRLEHGSAEIIGLPSTVAVALLESLSGTQGPLKGRPEAMARALKEQPSFIFTDSDWDRPLLATRVGIDAQREALGLEFVTQLGVRIFLMTHEVVVLF